MKLLLRALALSFVLMNTPSSLHGKGLGDLFLGLGFIAKEVCSCAFVVERSDEQCEEFAKLDSLSASITIDHNAKRARASMLWILRKTAEFDPHAGCRLK